MAEIINESNFDEKVMRTDMPVLVDFYSESCAPCRMLAPVIDKLAEGANDFSVYKVNVGQSPLLADRYGVMSIPTLIVFRSGEPAARHVGFLNPDGIAELLNSSIK